MLCPIALPIRPSSLRNLLPSRSSLNSHPAISRSTQVSVPEAEVGSLLAAQSLASKSIEHPFVANQVLSNESQAIPTIQVLPKKPSLGEPPELWVIESITEPIRRPGGDGVDLAALW